LVAEDNPAVRELVCRILSKRGYLPLEAKDGPEALEVAARHPGHIDLLLTDVGMPGMNGPELAERLIEARSNLRVLFMSGYVADAFDTRSALDSGASFLAKPFGPSDLERHVRSALDN
jgi:CheY-like chemotaxis protein